MKLLFLGTGAADWDASQAHLGDETALQRRTTSVLVNEDLLIDPNPAVPEAMARLWGRQKKGAERPDFPQPWGPLQS